MKNVKFIRLMEAAKSINEAASDEKYADRNILRAIAKEYYKSHNFIIKTAGKKLDISEVNGDVPIFEVGDHSREPNEIFRSNFKDDETARAVIVDIFDGKIDPNDISSEPEVVGRNMGGSGTYKSFKIRYKDNVWFIANKNADKANLHNKDLTPDRLLFNSKTKATHYESFSELRNAMSDSLAKVCAKCPQVIDLVDCIIDSIIVGINSGKYTATGSFALKDDHNEISLGEIFGSTDPGRLEIPLLDDEGVFKKVVDNGPGDIGCIEKDLGEIIGPLLFLKLSNDCVIDYPTVSNEKLIDYYVNGSKVSAKQYGGGGCPSGGDIMTNAKNMLTHVYNVGGQSVVEEMYDDLEIDFINRVASTYALDVFGQQSALITDFVLADNPDLANLIGFDLNSLQDDPKVKGYEQLSINLDKKFEEQDPEQFFKLLYMRLNYNNNHADSWTPDKIAKSWNQLPPKMKWGILYYPLYSAAVKEIQRLYGNPSNDIITSTIQKALLMKQVYFGVKKNKIIFEIKSASREKWKVTVGGLATTTMGNCKLAIKMTH